MILKKIIYIITLFLVNSASCMAQSKEEAMLVSGQLDHKAHTHHFQAKENKNEFQLFFSGLFLLYKKFLSSQDGQSCGFTPSCSEYGLIAVKQQGLTGFFNTFDRLSRCNGLNVNHYERDPKTGLLIDPVK